MTKVCLINPPQIFTKNQVAAGVTPPLGIAYLASYLIQHGHPVTVIDALGEAPANTYPYKKETFLRGLSFDAILEKIEPDCELIGISNLFSFAYPAVEDLARACKEKFPDVPIILGGPHPSAQYREILSSVREVEYVAIGEAEQNLLDLCRCLDGELTLEDLNGIAHRDDFSQVKLLYSTRKPVRMKAEEIPWPARELLPMENYIIAQESHGSSNHRWTSIMSSRGCPYGCTFCQSRKTRWIARDPVEVVDEIEECINRWGITEFHFEDDNMTLDFKRLNAICDEIIRRNLKIKWQTPNGIRASRTNSEMLQKMKESGCSHITLAPESGSQRVVDDIVKKGKDFSFDNLTTCGKEAHQIGMKVAAYFILGLPGEREEDVEQTIAYARTLARAGVDEVAFGLFIPLPGTPLWDECQDKIEGMDWLDLLSIGDLSKAVSFNDEMSADELNRLRRKAYFTFFFNKVIFHPIPTLKSFFNILRDIEETKSERVGRTLLRRYGFKRNKKEGGRDREAVASREDLSAYPYDQRETIRVLMKNSPHYDYGNSLLKAIKLLFKKEKGKTDR